MTAATRPTLWTSSRTAGTVTHLAAAVAGLDFDIRFLSLRGGDTRTPAYLALNPKGQVPALELADGTVITEAPAILTWIADVAPDSGLLPAKHPQRAKALEWMAWCQTIWTGAFGLAFGAKRIAGDDAAVAATLRVAGMERVTAAMALADAAIQPDGTLLGTGQPTAADLYLFHLTTFLKPLEVDISGLTGLASLRERVGALPGVVTAIAREAA